MIVSSPGSPSSSSDSQSGSDTIKHNIPSRVNSPNPRQSPSMTSLSRVSPNVGPVGRNSPANLGRASPSLGRASPSLGRASPNFARSSSPAMQASNAGLAVTMNGPSTLSALQTTISNINTTANNIFMSTNYTPQPPKYASTNPFLTGAYLTDAYDSYNTTSNTNNTKYNTIGGKNDKYGGGGGGGYSDYGVEASKYSTLGPKITSYLTDTQYTPTTSMSDIATSKYNTIGGGGGKYNTIGNTNGSFKFDVTGTDDLKSSHQYGSNKYTTGGGSKGGSYNPYSDRQQVMMNTSSHAGGGSSSSGLLGVEETPTPTSSIETEDSNTREVGEKDVEGDGEQSD